MMNAKTCKRGARLFSVAIVATTAITWLTVAGAQESANIGDKTDLLWHNGSTGEIQIWHMRGHRVGDRATVLGENGSATVVGLPWKIAGTNDMNQDGTADILWHNGSTGETQIWFMDGNKVTGRATVLGQNDRPALVGLPWTIAGTSDFNGDGKADIVWHNGSTGETQIWNMNGHRTTGRATVLGEGGGPTLVGTPWSIVGTNDMNGDTKPDIIWHSSSSGETQFWHMNGHKVSGRATVLGENGTVASVGMPWRIAATNDFNQDGTPDIVWHNGSTGETQIWYMNGYRVSGRATVLGENHGAASVGFPWTIAGTSDFNFIDATAGRRRPPASPTVTKDEKFGAGGAADRLVAALQPENSIKLRVQYKKELGYKGDTGAFGYLGPTSCDAFSVSVAVGDGSVRQRDPIPIRSDFKMEEAGGYYVCSYLVSEIPFDQTIRVGVRVSRLDLSAAWTGGGEAQPPAGQQRTILDSTMTETLTASRPRATLSFEMVYAPIAPR